MEIKKQANRIYLTPVQRAENGRKSWYNWYLNNKTCFKPGGHGYELMSQKITCECGRSMRNDSYKTHLKSMIHEKHLQKLA